MGCLEAITKKLTSPLPSERGRELLLSPFFSPTQFGGFLFFL